MTTMAKTEVSKSPILRGKKAVVFGAGGSIGAAVAKEFAAEGAQVFLVGRTKSNLERVATQIADIGGAAQTALVDALDDRAVNEYIDGIARQRGKLDVLLDVSGPLTEEYGNTKMAVDLPVDEFLVPLQTMVRSRFITARAAARQMIKQHSGVIIFVTGSPARPQFLVPRPLAQHLLRWKISPKTWHSKSVHSAFGLSAFERPLMSIAARFKTPRS
jgi:3-oxoacyl-[acyl-carrier protein] reductase